MFQDNLAMQQMMMHQMIHQQNEDMRSLQRMIDQENQRMMARQRAQEAYNRHMQEMEILRQIYEDEDNNVRRSHSACSPDRQEQPQIKQTAV